MRTALYCIAAMATLVTHNHETNAVRLDYVTSALTISEAI